MYRTAALAGTLSLALAMGPESAPSLDQSRRVDLEAADCSSINMTFGDQETARAVQRTSVMMGGAPLELRPDANGGVRIERGSGRAYEITACIAAGAPSLADAQAAADAVRLTVDGNRVRVTGVEGERARNWSVQLIVSAPDGASIDAETSNGPIGLHGVSGSFALRASNGPIGLDGVTGAVTARASNGPISVEGGSGQFNVETANGPISVRLTGQRWDGRLDARASNGPLTLNVPANYQSGVEVSSSAQSPWNCRASDCRTGYRDWDERVRSFRTGPDPVVVKLSTVNGPVTIRDR
jgi:DUF4097 and DUF4098 domain-containing protein YvlB